ncbi:hypothetical protein GY15_29130 [Delftia sp. 670]|uniref:hypothetical protein n=1 Tax=Delftia TaxID=80865 RepID=UPI0004D50864|nr:hypothetical protein [Delftia lacustris]KEH11383.1 hypothetical protein GY15_29130 [Delftia sp. 670]
MSQTEDTDTDLPPVEETTEHLQLPLPHHDNKLEFDVVRLRAALRLLDGVVHGMGLSIDTKAANDALQALEQATLQGLDQVAQQAGQNLTAAMQQVNQELAQLEQDISSKSVHLQAVADSTNADQAKTGETALRRLRQETANSSTNGQALRAGVEYTLSVDAAFSRPLPAAPSVGDRIELRDPSGNWRTGNFTLLRGNAAHTINGVADDVKFNTRAWRVRLEFAGSNNWTLTKG